MTLTARTDGDSLAVSTREIVDVALRSLRAHGASYATAQHAADLVEELQAVDGSGLPVLLAALQRPVVTATVRHEAIDAHGGSALLAAPQLGDLLGTSNEATLVNAGEPDAVRGVLRRVADASGVSLTAEWGCTDRELRGGYQVDSSGTAYRWGDSITGCPDLPTVIISVRHTAATAEASNAARLPAVAPALTRAREFGLTVERTQWTTLQRAAREFLLD